MQAGLYKWASMVSLPYFKEKKNLNVDILIYYIKKWLKVDLWNTKSFLYTLDFSIDIETMRKRPYISRAIEFIYFSHYFHQTHNTPVWKIHNGV